MGAPRFACVTLVGCGLVGGSFAAALRAAGQVGEIVGFDRDPAVAERARGLGLVDGVASGLDAAVARSDLVVVAVPVARTGDVLAAIAPHLPTAALVTDVGSTKVDVIAAARAALGAAAARFVPGHPIAGREVHGPDAADAGLFRDRLVLLTPLVENAAGDVDRIAAAWVACGARVERLDPVAHDAVLSSVSHLPHLLAYALVGQIADAADADLKFSLAGAGFRNFTRIAASSPEMWRDVALSNRTALLRDLDDYRGRLDRLHDLLVAGDGDALLALFATASAARSGWRQGG